MLICKRLAAGAGVMIAACAMIAEAQTNAVEEIVVHGKRPAVVVEIDRAALQPDIKRCVAALLASVRRALAESAEPPIELAKADLAPRG
jgi:hypothetical protein